MLAIRPFKKEDLPNLVNLIHSTIRICYPSIYSSEIVNFYLEYHSGKNILRRAQTGNVYLDSTSLAKHMYLKLGFIIKEELVVHTKATAMLHLYIAEWSIVLNRDFQE